MIHQVLLAHPGTQYSFQLAKQLNRIGCLFQFWTGLALAKEAWYFRVLQRSLPQGLYKKISNRIIEDIPASKLRLTPFLELTALAQLKQGKSSESVLHARNTAFQRSISERSIRQSSVVIGFDTSAWIIGGRARNANKVFLLDQSIAHPTTKEYVYQKVIDRFPQWQDSLEMRAQTVLDCERQEHSLAEKIVVASTFTKQTLVEQGIKCSKVVINPYGVDLGRFRPGYSRSLDRSIRFLFLGAVNARKGIPLLIEAWQSLELRDAELWIVGPIKPGIRSLIPNLPGLKILGSCPHEELPALLQQCDVLVFPSYFEGFGLVILEALASGLPVITTEATAGPDLITNGKEGFLIQSGDLDGLCAAMCFIMNNVEKLPEMSRSARHRAEQYSWDAYGDRWQQILQDSK